MEKIIVAIDGYAGTGKSTQAKSLAKHFGCVYVDTCKIKNASLEKDSLMFL